MQEKRCVLLHPFMKEGRMVYSSVYACLCEMCVRDRETQTERERKREGEGSNQKRYNDHVEILSLFPY